MDHYHSKDIRQAVVKSVPVFQIKKHRQEAILAGKPDPSWDCGILAAFFIPELEDVAGCKYSCRGYYSANHISAIEERLVVNSNLGESERQYAMLVDLVVQRGGHPLKGHLDVDGYDIL